MPTNIDEVYLPPPRNMWANEALERAWREYVRSTRARNVATIQLAQDYPEHGCGFKSLKSGNVFFSYHHPSDIKILCENKLHSYSFYSSRVEITPTSSLIKVLI